MGTEYLAVHPFADETALLAKLSWSADRCIKVDAYWHALGDVAFVQVVSLKFGERPTGRFVRRREHGDINLFTVTSAATITQQVFENELKFFLETGVLKEALDSAAQLGNDLVPVEQAFGDPASED